MATALELAGLPFFWGEGNFQLQDVVEIQLLGGPGIVFDVLRYRGIFTASDTADNQRTLQQEDVRTSMRSENGQPLVIYLE